MRRPRLMLIVSLLAIAFFIAFILRRGLLPTDGTRLTPGGITLQGIRIAVIDPPHEILQTGDLIEKVAGITIEQWANSLIGDPPRPSGWSGGDSVIYTVRRDGSLRDMTVPLGRYPLGAAFIANWGTIIYGFAFLLVGSYVYIRRPENRASQVLFFASACVIAQTAWSFGLSLRDLLDGSGYWLYWICTFLFYNLNWIVLFHFSLVFPQPAPLLRRRWLLPLVYLLPMLVLVGEKAYLFVQADSVLAWLSSPSLLEGIHPPIFLLMSLVAVVWQIRNSSNRQERRQIRWLLLASFLMGITVLLLYLVPNLLGIKQLNPNLLGLVIIPFPVSLAIAILRHNIFDIDTLLNRALVYGMLTLGTILLYVLIVGLAADRFGLQDRTLIAFLSTGLVAVLFQPIRERLQLMVNRLMYGDRDDPYTVISRLGSKLETIYAAEDVTATIVETIATALKLPYVAIQIQQMAPIHYGSLPVNVEVIQYPLTFRSQVYGELQVAPRAADEPFTAAEQQLLTDLTRQIETAVRNVQLMDELRRSRRQLVTTREEERRRIRRDLHDGLGPTLAGQVLVLETIEDLLNPEDAGVLELVESLKGQAREALEDVRRLVYDLRPPELDNLGMVEALRQNTSVASQGKVEFIFKAPEPFPGLSAAVELAAYRIAQEAIANVIKHANATKAFVEIKIQGDTLSLSVCDNGNGFPAKYKYGIGLNSMKERAEELGGNCEIMNSKQGGICILTTLPISID